MMWAVVSGLVVIFAGLTIGFEAIKGSRHMRTYDPGRGWHEGHDGPAKEFWAEVEPPVEPRNTWSNLAYYVAGWVPLVLVGIGTRDAPPIVFGLAMTWLCIGSALFHGTLTTWGQKADHSAMLTVFPVLAVYAAGSDRVWIAGPMILAGVAGGVLGTKWFPAKLGKHDSGPMNAAIGAFLALAALPALARGSWVLAVVSLVLFAGAAYLSLGLDKARARFMGRWKHAAWHGMTAAALSLMFLAQG